MRIGSVCVARATRPEQRLADLAVARLAVSVDPDDLRRFVIDHWSKVSALAHHIHDNAEQYVYDGSMT